MNSKINRRNFLKTGGAMAAGGYMVKGAHVLTAAEEAPEGEDGEIDAEDRRNIRLALRLARRRNPAMDASLFDFIGSVLLLEHPVEPVAAEQERVAFLLRPESYGQATTRVEAVETHMSRLFLTLRDAWKLKKPLITEKTTQEKDSKNVVALVVNGDANKIQIKEATEKLFKVKADFDVVMERTSETQEQYTAFIRKICQDEKLLPFDRSGVAAVIEYGVRLAGRQKKLSTEFHRITDILREASYWGKKDHSDLVSEKHVDQAIAEKIYRKVGRSRKRVTGYTMGHRPGEQASGGRSQRLPGCGWSFQQQ